MALTRPRAYQIYDIDYKQAVRVVTTTNISLSGGAPTTVDGVSLSLNDRILVTGQSTASQNGIYYVTALGTGSNGTWTRSYDTDATGELLSGTIVMVTEGAVFKDTQWKLTTDDPITIGSTDLTFVQNYSANSISAGTSNVVVTSNGAVTISSAGTANVLTVNAGSISVTGNIYPTANVTYGLGNTTNRFKDIWLSNSTIYLGNVALSADSTNLLVNGTNVVTETNGAISVSGNVTGGNITTAGQVSATGNVTGNYILGNVAFATGIPATYGNSNVAAYLASGTDSSNVVTTANVTGGNLLTSGLVSATGNVSGNYFLGNGSQLTGIISGGTISFSNTAPVTAKAGDVWIQANTAVQYVYFDDGTSNQWAEMEAYQSFSGSGGAVTPGGSNTQIQFNDSDSFGASANLTFDSSTNTLSTTTISATGNITGSYILGNGSQLTGLPATYGNSNVTTLLSNLGSNIISATGNITTTANISGNYFIGNGSQLTGISAGGTSNARVMGYSMVFGGF